MAQQDAKSAFVNRLRSLLNIDGYLLPELTKEQQAEFIRDPFRYLITTDKDQSNAIWREIEARQKCEDAPATAPDLLAALKSAVAIADEAAREWDAAPSGMRAGKLLLALCGHLKGYRADITAIHAAIAKAGAQS